MKCQLVVVRWKKTAWVSAGINYICALPFFSDSHTDMVCEGVAMMHFLLWGETKRLLGLDLPWCFQILDGHFKRDFNEKRILSLKELRVAVIWRNRMSFSASSICRGFVCRATKHYMRKLGGWCWIGLLFCSRVELPKKNIPSMSRECYLASLKHFDQKSEAGLLTWSVRVPQKLLVSN